MNITILQNDISHLNKEKNISSYNNLLGNLDHKTDLIIFPEMFNSGFAENLAQVAEDENGEDVTFLKNISKKYSANVVASTAIKEDEKIFNRLFWIDNQEIICRYDKHHLFFGDEKDLCTAGNNKSIVSVGEWNFLPLICYDIRFPEWSRNSYNNKKFLYDCIIYIANFPSSRIEILHTLAKARAIENQCYVIVTNRVGNNGHDEYHCGGSAFVDFNGNILAQAGDQPQLLSFDLSKEQLNKFRKKFPVYKDWD